MQLLGLERDDVITSSLVCSNCDIWQLGTNIPLNLFFFLLWREQYNFSDWLNDYLNLIKDLKFLFSNWLLTGVNNGLLSITRGGSYRTWRFALFRLFVWLVIFHIVILKKLQSKVLYLKKITTGTGLDTPLKRTHHHHHHFYLYTVKTSG